MDAAIRNKPNSIRNLIAAGQDVNYQNEKGSSALMVAAWLGNADAVRELLAATGINVNLADNDGNNAAMMAIFGCNDEDVVEMMVAAPGLDVNAQNNQGETLLHMVKG